MIKARLGWGCRLGEGGRELDRKRKIEGGKKEIDRLTDWPRRDKTSE